MHGFNKKRHIEDASKGYQVAGIWKTIQGEGPWAGMPATFIRLTGCNLACGWCDTVWDDDKDPYLTPDAIWARIRAVAGDCKLIVLTGGEPCRWILDPLLDALRGYNIQIETAGSHWQECLRRPNVTIVCSPKVAKVHPKFLDHCDHWKYVVTAGDASEADGLPIHGTQRRKNEIPGEQFTGGAMARPPKGRQTYIYLQPCDEQDPVKNKANMDHMVQISMKYNYRAGLQLHKIFGLE